MIKYGELTTKGDNRGTFIKLLEQNIKMLVVISDTIIEYCLDYLQTLNIPVINIVQSRDVLTTDYIEIAGYGATLLNVALVFMIAIIAIEIEKIPYTGITLAALFINACCNSGEPDT